MKRTQKYRELLEKQKKIYQESFEKLFLSVEMILDNVDQEFENIQRKTKQKPAKPDLEL